MWDGRWDSLFTNLNASIGLLQSPEKIQTTQHQGWIGTRVFHHWYIK